MGLFNIKWLPMLLIENANQVRQGAAATESFRNEMVKANEAAFHALPRLLSPNNDMRLINATDNH